MVGLWRMSRPVVFSCFVGSCALVGLQVLVLLFVRCVFDDLLLFLFKFVVSF